eukprot:TRINITY_DN5_c0_g2_i2.p1 TRINITY_DN5_c0_g2~~TRINITY_DN5_c0_g2_i2.p1  ORF type:complete len:784 (-),score=137.23 TRINITY_DN5_c0_g2_i2:96-2447(-)
MAYVFGLQTTNFLGQVSALATITVNKSTVAVPALEGPSEVAVSASEGVVLVQFALRPAECTPAGTVWTASWAFAPGSPTFALDAASRTSLALAISAGSLVAGADYTLVVTAAAVALGVSSSAAVTVKRVGAPLVAVVQGPSSVGADEALVLDASESYDPDNAAGAASFAWTCALCPGPAVSDMPCTQRCVGLGGSTGARLEVAGGLLLPGRSYVFVVAFSKGARRATASRAVAVQAAAAVAVQAVVMQASVLWQLTQMLTLNSSVCDTANPAVEAVIVARASGGTQVAWVFEAGEAAGERSVPAVVTSAAVSSGTEGEVVRIQAGLLGEWQGYTFYIRAKAVSGVTVLGSALVCFRVGEAPQIGSFVASQVQTRLRYSAMLESAARADFVIGFRLPGGPRKFISFKQGIRTSAFATVSRLNYYYDLAVGQQAIEPCPAALAYAFVFACQSGLCVEQEVEVPLDCTGLGLSKRKQAAVADCGAVPDPFQQALCAVQVVENGPKTASSTAAALAAIGAAHSVVPAAPTTLLVLASHHARVVRAAGTAVPTNLGVLAQLLGDASYAMPETLEALFESVVAQAGTQCSSAADAVLAQFGQKAAEATACGGTETAFAAGGVGVAASRAVVGPSGRVEVSASGSGVGAVAVGLGASVAGACTSVVVVVRAPECGEKDALPFVLAVAAEAPVDEVAFDTTAAGECAAWDSANAAWQTVGCTRSGARCTCARASKYTVVAARKSTGGGGSNAGAIAGGVVGAVVGIGAGVGAALWWRKQRERKGGAEVELQ